MKNLIWASLVVLSLALTEACAQETGYAIRGRVLNAYPDVPPKPSPQRVVLTPDAGTPRSITTLIRPDGTFELRNVASGAYSIQTDRIGVVSDRRVEVRDRDVDNVEIRVAQPIQSTLRIAMEDGSDWPTTFPQGGFRTTQHLGNMQLHGTVGQDGVGHPIFIPGAANYLSLLPPVGYFVKSIKAGSVNLLTSPLILEPSSGPVEIEAKISRTPLESAPTVKVSGRVTGNHPGMKLRLAPIGIDARDEYSTVTGADGTFEFRGVGPDIYTLDAPPAEGVFPEIIAVGKDVVGLEVPLPPGIIVSGRLMPVFDTAGVPMLPVEISVQFTSTAISKRLRFSPRRPFFEGLPAGSYRVSIEDLPAGYSVMSIAAGSANLLTSPFQIDGTTIPPRIEIVLRFDR